MNKYHSFIYPLLRASLIPTMIFLALSVSAEGYRITVKSPDIKENVAYLAYYYGDKVYMSDTAQSEGNGVFTFTGEEPLDGGLYIFAVNNQKVFEFLVASDQVMTFETNGPDYIDNMKIKGSPENDLFFENIRFNALKFKEVEPYRKALERLDKESDSATLCKEAIKTINDEVKDFKVRMTGNNPGTLTASFLRMLLEIEIPDPPVRADGTIDSTFQYHYYKSHYWDNTDLADDRLLRTPVLHPKIDEYFDKVVIQHPDSLIVACDWVINATRPNKEMFKYFVWYLTRKYETSKVMGFDKIFVHLVDNYYTSDQAFWTNPTVLKNITDRANQLRPILLGEKAPNMVMLDTNERPVSLHAIDARYIIIFFWDDECGHCKKETPILKKFYEENKERLGLEVFAVCTDTSYAKMKDYIRSRGLHWINVNGPRAYTKNFHDLYDIYSTPVMYLLDQDKTIIAKRLLSEQLAEFIERREENTGEDSNFHTED